MDDGKNDDREEVLDTQDGYGDRGLQQRMRPFLHAHGVAGPVKVLLLLISVNG